MKIHAVALCVAAVLAGCINSDKPLINRGNAYTNLPDRFTVDFWGSVHTVYGYHVQKYEHLYYGWQEQSGQPVNRNNQPDITFGVYQIDREKYLIMAQEDQVVMRPNGDFDVLRGDRRIKNVPQWRYGIAYKIEDEWFGSNRYRLWQPDADYVKKVVEEAVDSGKEDAFDGYDKKRILNLIKRFNTRSGYMFAQDQITVESAEDAAILLDFAFSRSEETETRERRNSFTISSGFGSISESCGIGGFFDTNWFCY